MPVTNNIFNTGLFKKKCTTPSYPCPIRDRERFTVVYTSYQAIFRFISIIYDDGDRDYEVPSLPIKDILCYR